MVINTRSYNFESVIKLSQTEESLALGICLCNVDRIEGWREVVEYAKKVVIVPEDLFVGIWLSSGGNGVDVQGGEVCHGPEETA